MDEAYRLADITVIPTLQSEGTSLSCLEAMASGNAVIATNVGGLPNLILPDYNGLLIEPNLESLRDALLRLIEQPQLRIKLAKQGVEVAKTFDIEIWRSRWQIILKKYLP
jgi:glycosyltransferase involved in cell wall biosynthesis